MKFRLQKFRDYIDRFLPEKTLVFNPSKTRFVFILFLLAIAASYFYIRSQEKSELELLRSQHQKIQLLINRYLSEMSGLNINSDQSNYLNIRLKEYRKKLSIVEEEINLKKRIWFLE